MITICGIAAFSIPMDAKVNARELAHALLTQIENRGTHASGFAYIGKDGSTGVYKQAKPGSQLSLGELPRDAKTVILHTRFATQGTTKDNRNNHPVMSTDNTVALVHNGVISNDYGLRGELGIIPREHGEVDSLVIPSLIAQQGPDSLGKLAGYAAVAWLSTQEDGELHIARLKSSPVAYTHLIDGTFVMASTPNLLTGALDNVNALYGGIFEMAETTMMSVHRGFIYANGDSPRMSYSHSTYTRYSSATAGGHGSNVTQLRGKGSEDDKPGRAVVFEDWIDDNADKADTCETSIGAYYEDLDKWRAEKAKNDEKMVNQALNRLRESGSWTPADEDEYAEYNGEDAKSPDDMSAAEWDAYVARMEESESIGYEGFYILDSSNDITHKGSLEALEQHLHWLSQITKSEFDIFQDVEDNIRWVNQIVDIGAVSSDGTLDSWVDDSAGIDDFESPAVRNLQYIREGAHLLVRLRGA